MKKPIVGVVCAIIEHQGNLLAVRRKKGEHMEGQWEFPGGKINKKEEIESSVKREVMEELGIIIEPVCQLRAIKHEYPEFIIKLIPFWCIIKDGKIKLKVHDLMKWVSPVNLLKVNWCKADLIVVHSILKKINSKVHHVSGNHIKER
jgi:8-oxo-dGTP diphosphatase